MATIVYVKYSWTECAITNSSTNQIKRCSKTL